MRKAVFDATLDVLAGGYSSLSIDAVAAKAGVNKTTIYRNWPTKIDLILAAAKDRSEKVINTERTGDLEHNLVALLKSVADNITSPVGRALIIATLNAEDDAEVRKAREEFWRARFEAAAGLVGAAIEDDHTGRDSDIQLFIERLIAPLYFRVFITGAPVDDAFIRETVRAALRLSPEGGTHGLPAD